jgi:hypothetical protein
VQRAVATDPASRYSSVTDVSRGLLAALRSLPPLPLEGDDPAITVS